MNLPVASSHCSTRSEHAATTVKLSHRSNYAVRACDSIWAPLKMLISTTASVSGYTRLSRDRQPFGTQSFALGWGPALYCRLTSLGGIRAGLHIEELKCLPYQHQLISSSLFRKGTSRCAFAVITQSWCTSELVSRWQHGV